MSNFKKIIQEKGKLPVIGVLHSMFPDIKIAELNKFVEKNFPEEIKTYENKRRREIAKKIIYC